MVEATLQFAREAMPSRVAMAALVAPVLGEVLVQLKHPVEYLNLITEQYGKTYPIGVKNDDARVNLDDPSNTEIMCPSGSRVRIFIRDKDGEERQFF